jgi:hypothetical protein
MRHDTLRKAASADGQTKLFKQHRRPKTLCRSCGKPIKTNKEAYVRYPDGKKVHLKCWEEERMGDLLKNDTVETCPLAGSAERVFVDDNNDKGY